MSASCLRLDWKDLWQLTFFLLFFHLSRSRSSSTYSLSDVCCSKRETVQWMLCGGNGDDIVGSDASTRNCLTENSKLRGWEELKKRQFETFSPITDSKLGRNGKNWINRIWISVFGIDCDYMSVHDWLRTTVKRRSGCTGKWAMKWIRIVWTVGLSATVARFAIMVGQFHYIVYHWICALDVDYIGPGYWWVKKMGRQREMGKRRSHTENTSDRHCIAPWTIGASDCIWQKQMNVRGWSQSAKLEISKRLFCARIVMRLRDVTSL